MAVQVIHVTGVASARTTGISLGAFLGRRRIAIITRVRQVLDRSHAVSIHALAVHSHAFSGHALANHSHAFSGHAQAVASGHAWVTGVALMLSNGLLFVSDAGSGLALPLVTGGINGVTGGTPAGGINGVTGGTATARAQMGATLTTYTIDSNGRYVAAATHPAANHAVLKPHGAAGPRIELGNALRNTDLLEIACLLQNISGGIFP